MKQLSLCKNAWIQYKGEKHPFDELNSLFLTKETENKTEAKENTERN